MMQVVVYHSGYGCATGCCGHVVQLGETERFMFDHPGLFHGPEDSKTFVQRIVTEAFGAEHVADINWDEIMVVGFEEEE